MTTHMYHISGLTDLSAQNAKAEKIAQGGNSAVVHEHSATEQCNTGCRSFLARDNKKEN